MQPLQKIVVSVFSTGDERARRTSVLEVEVMGLAKIGAKIDDLRL